MLQFYGQYSHVSCKPLKNLCLLAAFPSTPSAADHLGFTLRCEMTPSLILHQPLCTPSIMHLSFPPTGGVAFCCFEQLPAPSREARLWPSKTVGKGCFGAGTILQLFHGPRLHKWVIAAQVHHANQTSRSRRSSSGKTGVEQREILLVADTPSTGANNQTATVAAAPRFPPPQPQVGSPLLWIGVGVAISVFFSWAAKRVQAYALQQALKSVVQQSKQGNNQFGGMPVMPPGPFPFPSTPPAASPAASSVTVDVTASPAPSYEIKETLENKLENKKPAFTDVNVDLLEERQSSLKVASEEPQVQPVEQTSSQRVQVADAQIFDGASSHDQSSNGGPSGTSGNGKPQSFMSVEMLERMLDDPQVQKMVFPYLPEELRDPITFKRMIQLPPVRQQLQEALSNMGGEFGPDMMKYMNNDVVKQQFEQIGLTPEEVVGKILANPDIAASLQNTRVVEAIMDCSQNPLNITKYQNDKEVMDALFKIAELFPGATNSSF